MFKILSIALSAQLILNIQNCECNVHNTKHDIKCLFNTNYTKL